MKVYAKNAELVKRFKKRIGVKFESSGPGRLLKTVEVQVKFRLLIGIEVFANLEIITVSCMRVGGRGCI
jgi:hypothetical protein